MRRNRKGVCWTWIAKALHIKACTVSSMAKHFMSMFIKPLVCTEYKKQSKYVGVCVYCLGVIHILKEIQFLVFMAAPIKSICWHSSFFTVLLVSYYTQCPQLLPAAYLQTAAVSCCFPLLLSPGFIASSFNVILQLSGWYKCLQTWFQMYLCKKCG